MNDKQTRIRRWRLACGGDEQSAAGDGLSERDQRIEQALNALYLADQQGGGKKGKGGLGSSSPRVARWLVRLYPAHLLRSFSLRHPVIF